MLYPSNTLFLELKIEKYEQKINEFFIYRVIPFLFYYRIKHGVYWKIYNLSSILKLKIERGWKYVYVSEQTQSLTPKKENMLSI